MIYIKQRQHNEWAKLPSNDEFWKNVGIFSPLSVETQDEKDYLLSMQLMLGKDFIVLLPGEENPIDLPLSFVKVDLTLV